MGPVKRKKFAGVQELEREILKYETLHETITTEENW